MQARAVDTVGHLSLAVLSSETCGTPAEVAVELVDALSMGFIARVAVALIHFHSAVITGEPVRADTVVFCHARSAGTFIAGSKGAGIVQLITVFAHVADLLPGAEAGIVVHGVHTGGPIVAGPRQALVRGG